MTRNETLSNVLNQTLQAYNQGQYRYINEFVKQNKSGADLLTTGIYPNAKEITESYGAFNAIRTKLRWDLEDPSIVVVCVGDGRSPRTAALLAFRTKWQCISVDPIMDTIKIPDWESQIRNLKCIPKKVEDVDLFYDRVCVVAVHSHANMKSVLEHVRGKIRSMIAIECCVPYNYGIKPNKQYLDAGIWSPKNLVKVWKSI